jgi:pimeloyl-ACP methyl ester carboxylesterase/DNA-binding winged helix-turn-helix (wHTH) protein
VIYMFGAYELDTSVFELRRSGVPCSVEPQVFDLLRFLVENRDRVVTRQEILDAVWPDRVVSDSALASRLKSARKAIGDSGRSQAMIRTMHGRGVRFTAPVAEREDEDLDAEAPAAPPARAALSAPDEKPVTKYARSGLVNIAYQVVGSGPIDIVFVMGWVSHLEMFWVEPSFARFLRRLSGFGRLILFDKRGTGLSDHVPVDELPTMEQRMDDVRAVMDAAGSSRAVLVGVSEGAPLCVLFGATYPDRTAGLVLIGGYARRIVAPDYPWGDPPETRLSFIEHVRDSWGGPVGLEARAPSWASDAAFRDWWATYLRMGASPAAVAALMRMNDQIDVRDILPAIRVPTLVIHRVHERTLRVEHGRYLAKHIPGAEYVELPGDDHLPFVGNQDEILDPIGTFVSKLDAGQAARKSLATVLVLRGENLEERVTLLDSVAQLSGATLRGVSRDEIVVTLDHPGRAIRFARSVITSRPDAVGAVHTGECEIADGGVSGPAAEMASAIADLTRRGEVWVSSTVHDLVAGSGLAFRATGRTATTGAVGSRELFAFDG